MPEEFKHDGPIFIIAPVITSLSPSAATVNGAGFNLTVIGARFVNGSRLLWNKSSRTTAFVSTTQLTASILASDIAATSTGQLLPPATVVVANPDGAASNAVTFTIIPDINNIVSVVNTIQTMTAAQFAAQQPALAQAVRHLRSYLTNQDTTMNGLQSQLSAAQTQNANLTSQNADLKAQVTQQSATITQLKSQLAAAKNQQASPLDVAQSLKGVLDQIQKQARAAGGVQATLTNMNVQIKALVNVVPATATAAAQAVLVFPDPTALPDSNALSTISLSFSAIPNLKAAATGGTAPGGSTPGATLGGSAGGATAPAAADRTAPTAAEAQARDSLTGRLLDKIHGLGKERPEPGS